MIESNPCSSIRRHTVGGTETGRDRNLSRDEIKKFWNKLESATHVESDRKKGIYPIGKSMVTALTGRPSTKRSQSSSLRRDAASQQRAKRP